ncbi:amidohydrolase family protein [Micrococcales bacterium 31B]|nr:amidohydrolase family protein [Micrococcales bacterium 31B]
MTAELTTLIHGTVVLTPSSGDPSLLERGAVGIAADGRIAYVGLAADAPVAEHTRTATWVLPGLIDLHCHGGAGAGFPNAHTPDLVRRATSEHLRHGTTSMLASLVTDTREVLLERLSLLADECDAGTLVGIHSEGPFLSRLRCGAQDPASILDVDLDLVADMLAAARGHLRTMTYAPEQAGSHELIAALQEGGVIPSIGHTDATATATRAAIAATLAGTDAPIALTATHLFNGMRPVHHRTDGPILELLAAARPGRDGRAVVELIADNVHLSPDTVREVFALVGADSIALVTDAMAACGMPDGTYQLGALAVRVADGVARLAEGDSIAGGTAHLIEVVARTVAAGVPLEQAVAAAALTPARVLSLDSDRGSLEPGKRADVLLCDDAFGVLGVLRAGAPVPA